NRGLMTENRRQNNLKQNTNEQRTKYKGEQLPSVTRHRGIINKTG
ncbi:hypothetical protein MNBD_GAMMA01-2118, partial [hydrothermal vent metagenome]